MRAVWSLALVVVGCAPLPEPPPPPCAAEEAALELAPPFGAFGELEDGGELWCGDPPQGGAPYSPFRVRIEGPEALADGVSLQMTATDAEDGGVLGSTGLVLGLVCANAGESAGTWVGGEAHLRYEGSALEDLDGRAVDLVVTATSLGAEPVVAEIALRVHLVVD